MSARGMRFIAAGGGGGGGGGTGPLGKFTGNTAPTAGDDELDGYSAGSLWVTTWRGVWIAKSVATGLADWYRVEALNKLDATAAPTSNEDANDGYSVGSLWVWPRVGTWVCSSADTGGSAAWVRCASGAPYAQATVSAGGSPAYVTVEGFGTLTRNGVGDYSLALAGLPADAVLSHAVFGGATFAVLIIEPIGTPVTELRIRTADISGGAAVDASFSVTVNRSGA